MSKIVLLRHAKTLLNVSGKVMGDRLDESISKSSLERYSLLGQEIDSVEKVFSSPMRRAVETAQHVFHGIDVCCDERLRARGCGSVAGLSIEQIAERFPQSIIQINGENIIDASVDFGDVESFNSVVRRVSSFLKDISHYNKVAVVTHSMVGIVLMALCSPRFVEKNVISSQYSLDFAKAYYIDEVLSFVNRNSRRYIDS